MDGGKTWKKILYVDKHTGVNDLVLDPREPDTIYCTTWQRIRLKWNDPRTYKDHKNNGIRKSTDGGNKWEKINRGLPAPWFMGRIGIDIAASNPDIVYHGMQFVMMSRDRGNTWEKISPDLSYNDPNKQGDINYQTITALSESPKRFGLIYAGTDDGRIWRTMNGGKKWEEIGGGNVPVKWVSRLVASKYNLGTVYLTQTGRRDDDFQIYVWKSIDFGKTWVDISGNIPVGPVNVIREDPVNAKKLFVGTDAGVYISKDGGEKWEALGNLPFAYVHDLVIHPRDKMIIIATHGRGMWVFDAEQIDRKSKKGRKKSLSPDDYKTLSGNWIVETERFSLTITFSMKGDVMAGKMSSGMGDAEISDIEFDGKTLTFKAAFKAGERVMEISAEAQIEGEKIKGTLSSPMGKLPFTGEKEKKKEKI
jgi:photosystem II stability/assembly factor-like uncharacterized protein